MWVLSLTRRIVLPLLGAGAFKLWEVRVLLRSGDLGEIRWEAQPGLIMLIRIHPGS